MKHWFKKCWCILTFCLILLSFNMTVNAAYAQCSYPADYDVVVSAPDGGVNLREGLGTEYNILYHMIPNGTVLHISADGQSSNNGWWGNTCYNGIYGWIALSQVTVLDEPIEEVSQETVSTSSYGYDVSYDVVVSAPDGGVNLRGGVGTSYEILYHMIPNNVTLHISKEAQASNGNYWGYTYYDGIYGWIALSQVSVVESKTPFEELLVEDILIEVTEVAEPVNILYKPEPLTFSYDIPEDAINLLDLISGSSEKILDELAAPFYGIEQSTLTDAIFTAAINAIETNNYSGCYNLSLLYKRLFPQGEYENLFTAVEEYAKQLKEAAEIASQDQSLSSYPYTIRYMLLSRENALPFTGSYIFPASDKRIISYMDLNSEEIVPARILDGIKEIYARHGKRFLNSSYQDYFDGKSWYNGTVEPADFSYSMLSYVERKNLGILLGYFHNNINLVEEDTNPAIPNILYVVNCNESITLRNAPNVNAGEICQIPLNAPVFFIENSANGFFNVYYQGAGGYCLSSYLSDVI